jgi:hypothetical protein
MPASVKLLISVFLCAELLVGCATAPAVNRYHDLASAPRLAPNRNDNDGHLPYRYDAVTTNWSSFTRVILDPVAIYAGADGQFGGVPEADKTALADYMQAQFTEVLSAHYSLADLPGPDTLRIHVTLTGIQTSTPGVSTLWKVAPVGLLTNSVQSARDKPAAFSGSVSYAVEVYDSSSNMLLRAYIARQYPFAEDVAASVRPLDASRAGIRKGAQALIAQLQ